MSDFSGMPPDLVAVLSNPGVVVPQDAFVFDLIATWANAPTPTASAKVAVAKDDGLLERLARHTRVAPATTGVGC